MSRESDVPDTVLTKFFVGAGSIEPLRDLCPHTSDWRLEVKVGLITGREDACATGADVATAGTNGSAEGTASAAAGTAAPADGGAALDAGGGAGAVKSAEGTGATAWCCSGVGEEPADSSSMGLGASMMALCTAAVHTASCPSASSSIRTSIALESIALLLASAWARNSRRFCMALRFFSALSSSRSTAPVAGNALACISASRASAAGTALATGAAGGETAAGARG
mmetsp:Transcript_90382/g.146242  ORF Transcript_90382/g.146242 Transcript_90382/m.146242 type:complete len:226 (+) Transcript_90382:217-894(+)